MKLPDPARAAWSYNIIKVEKQRAGTEAEDVGVVPALAFT